MTDNDIYCHVWVNDDRGVDAGIPFVAEDALQRATVHERCYLVYRGGIRHRPSGNVGDKKFLTSLISVLL